MSHPSNGSPFSEAGRELIANGYSPIPIAPGDKVPGLYAGSEWRMMRGWSKFCSAPAPAFQIATWLSWPNAGVGAALGSGVLAVDIDLEEAVAPLMAVLPPSNVAKRGAKGLTLFFRGDTSKIRSRAFKIDGIGAVDLLADGKQTVLPPSVHPKTGLPYEWKSFRTLLDTPVADLVEAPDNVAELIEQALRPLGYKAEASFEFSGEINESNSQSTDFFRRLNEDALANLDAWVPRLNLYRAIRNAGGWRAVPHWRPSSTGNPPQKRKLNLSFDPKGIRDFGDGGKTYTPLNVVMAACDLGSDLDTAAKWLGEMIGYDFSPVIDLVAGPSAPSVLARAAERLRANAPPPSVPAPVLAVSEPIPEAVSPPRPAPVGDIEAALSSKALIDFPAGPDPKAARIKRLEALTYVHGLVGEVTDWIEASARFPCRPLALAAALCAVGAIAGRQYGTPTDLRTNLYIIGLAESGYGKDHALSCIGHLFERNGMDRFVGGSKIMSGTGLREQMTQQPSTLYLLDEYAGLMRDIYDRRAGSHMKMLRDYILEFYSKANQSFKGADYAAGKTQKIMNPNLVIYGVSTPDDFWNGMGSGGVADGFIARQIVLTIDAELPDRKKPTADNRKPPQRIVDGFHSILESKIGDLAGATHDGTTAIDALLAEWGPGAEEFWDAESDRVRHLTRAAPSQFRSVYNRLAENAQKMATVIAIGVDPNSPVVTREMIEWGFDLSWLSVESVIDEIKGRLADSDYQRLYLEVRRHIEKAGRAGLTRTELKRKLNGKIEVRKFDDIIENLKSADDVDVRMLTPATGGPTSMRFVFLPESGGAGLSAQA